MAKLIQEKHEYGFIIYLRVLAMAMIIFHHFANQSSNVFLSQFGQLCRLGVYIFFIISGFLFGIKKSNGGGYISPWKWYKKRIKRIYIPLELFVVSLAAIYIIAKKPFLYRDWILLVLGLPGNTSSITEARHIWFITALLLCYLLTPFMGYIVKKLSNTSLSILIALLFVLPIPLMLIKRDSVMILGTPVLWYFLAYILGTRFEEIGLSKARAICTFGIIVILFGVRLIVKHFFDGMWIYDRFTVQYVQTICAFCFLLLFSFVFQGKHPGKVICFLGDISFECYLYHYIFAYGVLSLFQDTIPWCISCILAGCITVIVAFLMNRLAITIQKRLI